MVPLSTVSLPSTGAKCGSRGFPFERQVGFCGHYAGALAALMRAADVPARVVSRYQGGTLEQPLSGGTYLNLRQSDAHAWTEVWLQDQGWQAVDPTTWIGSGRLAQASRERVAVASQARFPLLVWIQREWWALDLAWTRWWLGLTSRRKLSCCASCLVISCVGWAWRSWRRPSWPLALV